MIDSNVAVPMQLSSNAVVDEFNGEGSGSSKKLKSWELWSPDPIDAINNNASDGSNMGSKSNIITMLVRLNCLLTDNKLL